MREIKFRAWSVTAEAMSLIDPKHPEGWLLSSLVTNDSWKVMQYTGLKDKSGEDLYEGDILEYEGIKFPVTVNGFHGYRFMFGADVLCAAFTKHGEILGNIFEHPELLK